MNVKDKVYISIIIVLFMFCVACLFSIIINSGRTKSDIDKIRELYTSLETKNNNIRNSIEGISTTIGNLRTEITGRIESLKSDVKKLGGSISASQSTVIGISSDTQGIEQTNAELSEIIRKLSESIGN